MKQIIRQGTFLFGRTVMVIIMSVFICTSMTMLCTAGFTQKIGYEVYGFREGSEETVLLYTHYHQDGEDTQLKEYEELGYTLKKNVIRSELSKAGKVVYFLVTQTVTLCILAAIIYPKLWELGARDSNLVHFKHQEKDTLKGLKIGIVSQIPALLLWVGTAVLALGAKSQIPVALYRFLNCHFFPLIQVICGSAKVLADLSVVQLLLLLSLSAIVPFISWLAYFLGFRDFSISEKLIYKNSKKQKR